MSFASARLTFISCSSFSIFSRVRSDKSLSDRVLGFGLWAVRVDAVNTEDNDVVATLALWCYFRFPDFGR